MVKQEEKDLLLYENTLWAEGYTAIAGIDEAGRGPLAGSVYARGGHFAAGVPD